MNNGNIYRIFEKKLTYDLYASTNIIRMIKSRKIRRAVHVACMEKWEYIQNIGRET